MSLRLVRAEKADIPKLVDLYFDTFKSPLVLRVKPDVPPVREWYKKSLESDIEKPHIRIYKVVEGQAESVQASDEIIAFAKWNSPHTEPPQEKSTEWPVDGNVALFEEVVGKATEKQKNIMGEEKYWCKLFDTIQTVRFNSIKSFRRHRRPRNLAKAPAPRRGIATYD
jgi:hypothetical protein